MLKLLFYGLVGMVFALVVPIAIVFIFKTDNLLVKWSVCIPAGFGVAGGLYLHRLKRAKMLNPNNVILALAVGALVGLVFGMLGREIVHPGVRDSFPFTLTIGVPGMMALSAFWPIR